MSSLLNSFWYRYGDGMCISRRLIIRGWFDDCGGFLWAGVIAL